MKIGADMKKEGLIRHFGFSCHLGKVVELMNKAATIGPDGGIDALMFRYNFTKYGDVALNKAIDACKEAEIGLLAMKTQASVPDDSKFVKEFKSDNFTLPQAKLKAVWADDRIDACTSEMTNIQQLEENTAAAVSPMQLGMDEFQQLNRFAANTAHERCQGCDQICESRVNGDVRIADTLRFLMYAECYGNTTLARQRYRALTDNERYIDAVQLASATAACPQGIDIAGRLEVARARLA
jgi:predicted aldo/keto reductase-like oxidoreductase